jgi:hypothetical protein
LLEAAHEPEQAAGRLKQLIAATTALARSGDPVEALARMARVVKTVGRLRSHGALDAIASIRARADGLYPTWDGENAGRFRSDIEALTEQAGSVALLEQSDVAFERDARIFEAFARDYRTRHAARHALVAEALAKLEAHEAWPRADASIRDRLRAAIAADDCDDEATLAVRTAPDGRCPRCRASLAELRTQIEVLEARELRAIAELDALTARRPPTPPSGVDAVTVTMDLTSPDDLAELHRRIDEVGKDALTRPRRVTVIFEKLS